MKDLTSNASTSIRPKHIKIAIASLFVAIAFGVTVLNQNNGAVHAVEGTKPVNEVLQSQNPMSGFADMVAAVTPTVVSIEVFGKTLTSGSSAFESPMHDQNRQFGFPEGADPFEYFFGRNWRERFEQNRVPRPAPRMNRPVGVGSGVIVDPNGYVVTNFHVIDEADRVRVTLNDGKQHDAQIVGVDKSTDLAVLKIDADTIFPYVRFGDSQSVRVGDFALAIGNPFGLSKSVSLGIISAKGRDLWNGNPNVPLLQSDVAVNKGNSGGPLFDTQGDVIGINTMIFSQTGYNTGVSFAIPSNVVESISLELIDDGYVDRGWLGVLIQPVSDPIAQTLGLPLADDGQYGALVAQVTEQSPAEAAGIIPGDVVVEFDGHKVGNVKELSRQVQMTKAGSEVTLKVFRNAEVMTLHTTIASLNGEAKKVASSDGKEPDKVKMGIAIAELDSATRTQYAIADDVEGVVILDIEPDSPAARADLRTGDVIKSINNKRVASKDDAAQILDSLSNTENENVLVLIEREGTSFFSVVGFS